MQNYDNPQCTSVTEFEEDIKRFIYLKKLFSRYTESGDLRERLIINHLVILHNVFGLITTEMLFFKIEPRYWNILATFLHYINQLPDTIPEHNINTVDFEFDNHILKTLGITNG